jgi:spore germination protein YaaH
VAPKIRARPVAALLAAAVLAAGLVPAASLGPGPLSAPAARAADPGLIPRVQGIRTLSHEVFGYLPYWRLDSTTAEQLHYELLSTIGLFGIGIKSTGDLDTAWVGYTEYVGPDAAAVTNAAHAAGVRVVPTFQLFDSGALPKLTAFLGSTEAQDRFIDQAIELMQRRLADGASLDFEPMPREQTPQFLAFVERFATAMRAAIPGAILVDAASAGAPWELIRGLAPIVDHMFVMTYNYRWSGSKIAGAVAPLDNATRNVSIHIERFLANAPASKIIMGVPYYGYDWPVTSGAANATVQADPSKYGGVWSLTYKGARDFLAEHTHIKRQYDAVEGSAYFTYQSVSGTWRQAYYDDEQSIAAKYDFAMTQGLAGVGIWALQYDRGYEELWGVLRAKFYAPVHDTRPAGRVGSLARHNGVVTANVAARMANVGTVPERGTLRWGIKDSKGRWFLKGSRTIEVMPGASTVRYVKTTFGRASALPAGTYTLVVRFQNGNGLWSSPPYRFRQPY